MKTAATQSVPKTIAYQQGVFLVEPEESLQDMLIKARTKRRLARQREWHLGDASEVVRVWNGASKRGHLTCGMFHSYEHGRSQLILSVNGDLEEYPIAAAEPPPTADSKHTEFNEGLLFFGIFKNHALVLQSSALKIPAFENYLNWFLQESGAMAPDNRLELRDPLPSKIRKKRHTDPLSKIVISPELRPAIVETHKKLKEVDTELTWGFFEIL